MLTFSINNLKRLRLSITKASGDKIFSALDVGRSGDLPINITQPRHQQNPLATHTAFPQLYCE